MAATSVMQIESLVGPLITPISSANTNLVSSLTMNVYQNLLDRIQSDEKQLRTLYVSHTVKLEPSLKSKGINVLEDAGQVVTLLLSCIGTLTSVTQPTTRLPRLKELPLPMIKGEKSEFATFTELFYAHARSRPDLDDVAKYTYLLGSLEGELLEVVQSFSVTAANYQVAHDLLEKYYGNQQQTLVILHRRLANLFVPKCNYVDLKNFRIELTVLIERIKHLSRSPLDHGMLLSLINQKLSQGQVYCKIVEYLHKCDFSLNELFKALDFIIRSMKDDALQKGEELSTARKKGSKANANHATTCLFCNGNHSVSLCVRYSTVAAKKRQLILNKKCFNCLASGHTSRQCNVKCNCKLCDGRHHSFAPTNNPSYQSSSKTSQVVSSPVKKPGTNRRISQRTQPKAKDEKPCVIAKMGKDEPSTKLLATLLPTLQLPCIHVANPFPLKYFGYQ
ncbi:uncharacterized protein LOC135196539 [Macrobrachium nipponense]|uniref:uncharacterized protein LOC135196539 n=1 Tax=Macrobrachium nipponense TaxID=159736 RepID=UPI0030C8CFD6